MTTPTAQSAYVCTAKPVLHFMQAGIDYIPATDNERRFWVVGIPMLTRYIVTSGNKRRTTLATSSCDAIARAMARFGNAHPISARRAAA